MAGAQPQHIRYLTLQQKDAPRIRSPAPRVSQQEVLVNNLIQGIQQQQQQINIGKFRQAKYSHSNQQKTNFSEAQSYRNN